MLRSVVVCAAIICAATPGLAATYTSDVGGSGGSILSIGNNMVPRAQGPQKSAIAPY